MNLLTEARRWCIPEGISRSRPVGAAARTTGLAYFAECHRHSAKAEKHSANSLPSVALGEAYTAFLLPAKPALPSAFSRALGKPLPCAKSHSAKKVETGRTDGQLNWRTGRRTGERDGRTGRVENFAECHMLGTRQRFKLRRVPTWPHSAKFGFLPSVRRLALGEVWVFAECHSSGTRRSLKLRRVPR